MPEPQLVSGEWAGEHSPEAGPQPVAVPAAQPVAKAAPAGSARPVLSSSAGGGTGITRGGGGTCVTRTRGGSRGVGGNRGCFRGAGAGVGAGVHDGEEVFELFGGREDLDVVQAVAPAADEGALELTQQLLGGFGAVLVDRVGPAAGDPGQEVGVVLRRPCASGRAPSGPAASASQACLTFSSARVMTVAARDATSPAATAAPSSSCTGRHRLPGESPAGQQTLGQGEPAPGFRRTDQQPGPQELRRVPVPVIHRPGQSSLPGTSPDGVFVPARGPRRAGLPDIRRGLFPGPVHRGRPRQPANIPPCGRVPRRCRRSPTPPSIPRRPRPPAPSHSRPGATARAPSTPDARAGTVP